MHLYQFVNYFDVYGNPLDGYEVNNLCHEPYFIKADYLTKESVLKALKKAGFLKKTCRMASLVVTVSDGDFLEIEDRNGRPIGRFELAYNKPEDYGCPVVYTPRGLS